MDTAQLLEQLTIPSPCTVGWDTMSGDDRSRFCGQCEKTVYNLSAMTADEAGQLIRGQQGRLCARFFRRPDGTIVTQDCAASRANPIFGNDGESRPVARGVRRAGRGLQFGLSTLLLLMIGCATALGIARAIPPRWIATAQSWLAPEPELVITPSVRPAPNPGYYEDVGMVVDDDFSSGNT